MVTKRRVITVDNGGSEIRTICNSNNREMNIINKTISIVDPHEYRKKDSVGDYDIINVIEAPNADCLHMFAMGQGYYMYSGIDVVMNNQIAKTDSPAWYQQLILAVAIDAMKAIRKEVGESYGTALETPVEYEYVLTTLIPVREHSGSVDCVSKLKSRLAGNYTVEFPMMNGINQVSFSLSASRIGVLPEGVVSMTALRDVVTPMDHTLIIDMGHVTTDLVICKGTNMIGSSVVSSPFAGGTLLKLIGNIIRNNGYLTTTEMEIQALKNFEIRVGSHTIDVSEDVKLAKQMFVTNYIKNEILNQIELAGLGTSHIQYIVPIGAVLDCTDENGDHDILNSIIKECHLDKAEIKLLSGDLRYVNINKAADFADALAKSM